MITLRERLEQELQISGPSTEWYKLFQQVMKKTAGNWPPRYFVEFDLDASNEQNWQYAEKKDLTQKFFQEHLLNPARRKIEFVMSGLSDIQIKKNAKIVVNQFLVDISRGGDDKRAFKLIGDRLKIRGVLLEGGASETDSPTVLSNQRLAEKVQRILTLCPERLPNAFLPAGEGERESPNWTPKGYDWIAERLIELDEPLTELALRDGISEALTHLRLSLYYLDEPNKAEGSEMASWEEARESEEEVYGMGTYVTDSPEEITIALAREKVASEILAKLSPDTVRFLSHATISKDMTKLADSLGVTRQKIYVYKEKSVNEVNHILNEMNIEDPEAKFVRNSMFKLINPPLTSERGAGSE
jgi:hypothetical protein